MASCEKCKKEIDGTYGSGRFCSRSCANSKTHSELTRRKQSDSMKHFILGLSPEERLAYENNKKSCDIKVVMQERSKKNKQKKLSKIASAHFDELSMPEKRRRIDLERGGKCLLCDGGKVWMGRILTLELDHVDGDRLNNTRENLRLICPNCHSTTPTFRRRNAKSKVSDLQIIECLKQSYSGYEVIKTLGLNSGSYKRLRRIINLYGLQLSYEV